MKKLLIALLVLVVGAGGWVYWYISRFTEDAPPNLAATATQRSIDSGNIVGYVDRGSHAWVGIPFAAPPVDELRWKAPRPVEPWANTLEALEFGSQCPQSGFGGGPVAGAEDCLYLNVWAPIDPAGQRPVMYFIHGGGNHLGEGATPIYHGARYAREHDVVVVTINYRLGPFGWLAHPGLRTTGESAEALADNSGNYGTLDIIHGLKWVQRNIAAFGGDSQNVTIFGESAGGFDVLTMMVSPLASGLYHKAISQSGGMTLVPVSEAENYADDADPGHGLSSRELVNKLLVDDGRAADRDAAKAVQLTMSDAEVGEYLRGKTADEIMMSQDRQIAVTQSNDGDESSNAFVLGDGIPTKTPYIFGDGHVLPAGVQLDWLFADPSRYNVTPVILGSNRNETRLFMAFSPGYTDRIFGVPYQIRDEVVYERDTQYGSDIWKADAVDELAILLRASQGDSVYAYRFDWDELRSLLTLDLSKLLGAAHALELPFVFGMFDLIDKTLMTPNVAARDALSHSIMSYWAEFAYNGNPGRGRDGSEVAWAAWQSGVSDNRILLLDTLTDGGVRMSPLLVTRDTLRDTLAADERFTDEERCALAGRLFADAPLLESC